MTATLRAEGVTKSFGGVQALADCSLTVPAGSISGLIGPNGSGKTTLFNVMTGYERIETGQVFLGDMRITGAPPQRVFALGVGRTFQMTRIFPRLTVLENMLVPARRGNSARQHRDHALDLLAFTGIAAHAGALAGTLSYGQRKLLELAYVLVSDPAVVLLDEPAGGVNPSLIHHIADRIRELNKDGRTFLIVEHNMEFVMGLCHELTVLDSGAVVASGPPDAIRSDPRVLDAYLGIGTDGDE
jgi:ABC-type branched-subunit amino acid transport system ATPase component